MIKFFLNLNNGFKIEIFSIWHLFLIFITFFIIFIVYKNQDKIRNLDDNKKRKIRHILAFILIINLLLRRGSFLYYGYYEYKYHLDINICNFTNILFILYGLTGNKKIYNLCYYMAILGPMMAVLFPSVTLDPLNYSFYSFILIHHVVLIFNFIFLYMEDMKFSLENLRRFLYFFIVYLGIVFYINQVFNFEYNTPLNMVNNDLMHFKILEILGRYEITQYLTMFMGIIVVLIISIIILKKLGKKNN